MEKIPNNDGPKRGKEDHLTDDSDSRFGTIARTAMIGVAIAGAGAPAPVEAGGPVVDGSRYEQAEGFSVERETRAFLDKIAGMEIGFDDARGRQKLTRDVQKELNLFALALRSHVSYFSANSSSSMSGEVSAGDLARARDTLLPRLIVDNQLNGTVGVNALRQIIRSSTTAPLSPQKQKGLEDFKKLMN